jgi:predicted Zn-dependent peptidase
MVDYGYQIAKQGFDVVIMPLKDSVFNRSKSNIKLMKKALFDMENGNISEEELDNAKKLVTTNLNMSLDNPGRIIDNYIFKNLYGLSDIEVRIENYNKVTKQDIINFSKKVKMNTILCVRDGENEKN